MSTPRWLASELLWKCLMTSKWTFGGTYNWRLLSFQTLVHLLSFSCCHHGVVSSNPAVLVVFLRLLHYSMDANSRDFLQSWGSCCNTEKWPVFWLHLRFSWSSVVFLSPGSFERKSGSSFSLPKQSSMVNFKLCYQQNPARILVLLPRHLLQPGICDMEGEVAIFQVQPVFLDIDISSPSW